eukprot:6656833-Pyramimonas_sp.AAC.1
MGERGESHSRRWREDRDEGKGGLQSPPLAQKGHAYAASFIFEIRSSTLFLLTCILAHPRVCHRHAYMHQHT